MPRPPLALGFSRPPRGFAGLVGRLIAWRQGLFHRDGSPITASHVRVALGDGQILEMTWPRWRIRSEEEDAAENPGMVWYEPPFYLELERLGRLDGVADALASAGGRYGVFALLRAILVGTLGKAGWVCSSGAALVLRIVTGIDVSGTEQPENVDLRTLLTFVKANGWKEVPCSEV